MDSCGDAVSVDTQIFTMAGPADSHRQPIACPLADALPFSDVMGAGRGLLALAELCAQDAGQALDLADVLAGGHAGALTAGLGSRVIFSTARIRPPIQRTTGTALLLPIDL